MKHRQVQALRARVAVLWKAMNAARLEYLQAQLDLRTLQGNELACERLSAQLRNLLNMERPKQTARKGSAVRCSMTLKAGAFYPTNSPKNGGVPFANDTESGWVSSGNSPESVSVSINRNAVDAVARGEEVSK